MRVVWIGAGNLATRLGLALKRAGHETLQVFSRTEASAVALAEQLDCPFTCRTEEVLPGADVYLFAVKDSVLEELAGHIAPKVGDALCLHTAGSMPMDVFRGRAARYGVLYPMQTFSKHTSVDFREIPVFLEASDASAYGMAEELARSVSGNVRAMSSADRRYLHLAAVFACNFVNHCYALSEEVLQKIDAPFEVMRPLIDETARKVRQTPPREAQTGPAVRYDRNVMDRQLALLEDEPDMQAIYEAMSRSIHRLALEEKKKETDDDKL